MKALFLRFPVDGSFFSGPEKERPKGTQNEKVIEFLLTSFSVTLKWGSATHEVTILQNSQPNKEEIPHGTHDAVGHGNDVFGAQVILGHGFASQSGSGHAVCHMLLGLSVAVHSDWCAIARYRGIARYLSGGSLTCDTLLGTRQKGAIGSFWGGYSLIRVQYM